MPVYVTKKGGQPRKNSLTIKLVWIQVRRVIAIMLMLDIMVCLLFALGIFLSYEDIASDTIPAVYESLESAEQAAPPVQELSEGYTLEYVEGDAWGFSYDRGGSVMGKVHRAIYTSSEREPWFDRSRFVLYYVFSVNAGEPGMVYRFSYDIGGHCFVFLLLMLVLFLVELFWILTSVFKARRNIRRALAPIDELTSVARSIAKPSSPGRDRIKLDKTIETLNAITGDDLDKRISIEDEREELQGLAAAINNMLERLDDAYTSQLRFVSDASHELRTPIAVIQGYANLLDRWGKEDEQTLQEAIDAIKGEAENMKELMEQLLFLARSDNQSIPMDIEDLNLSALVEEVCEESRMIDRGHTIDDSIQPEVAMQGDTQLVKQAIRIIVDNSIKYTPDNGSIKLRVFERDNYAVVSVTDEGVGIADEDLPKVFDRFYRADDSRDRQTGGTGLGLSIANWIVDAHKGFIQVTSRQDIGTRFELVFPKRYIPQTHGDIS